MQVSLKKKIATLLVGLTCTSYAFAANPAQPGNAGTSNAVAFAIQAGAIAGAAQACGINVAVFSSRVTEAISKLANNANDQSAAIGSYQNSSQQAQAAQSNTHPLACTQVSQDFNNLPLMRPDYEQTVINQLTPGAGATTSTANNSTATSTVANTTNAANSSPVKNMAREEMNPASTGTLQNQQNLNNQAMPNTAADNTQTNSNPAYHSPVPGNAYGPITPSRNNFQGAINSLNASNMQSLQPNNASAQPNTQQNPGYQSNQNSNPPPPSFSNPNNGTPNPSNNSNP